LHGFIKVTFHFDFDGVKFGFSEHTVGSKLSFKVEDWTAFLPGFDLVCGTIGAFTEEGFLANDVSFPAVSFTFD